MLENMKPLMANAIVGIDSRPRRAGTMLNQLKNERRNYEELEDGREDRDCGAYRIVRRRWRLRLRTGNDVTQAPLDAIPAGLFFMGQTGST